MTADQLMECRYVVGEPFLCNRYGNFEVFDSRNRNRVALCLDRASAELIAAALNTHPTAVASHAEGEVVAYSVPSGHAMPDGSMEDGPWTLVFADEASDYEKRIGIPLYYHPPRFGDEARDAAYRNLLAASKTYFIRYCVDEADEDPQWTGCSEQQSIDARELRDAIDAGMAARGDDK